MSQRNLLTGTWHVLSTEAEHANLKRHSRTETCGGSAFNRIQRGIWQGPGAYYLLTYSQRCPRNCCDDSVGEVLSASDVVVKVT